MIEGSNIEGGVYTLSWVGAGTASVNGTAIANGAQTASLTAAANVTVKFVGAVSKVQFELGSVATPFEQRHPTLELMLGRRYYYRNTNAGQGACRDGLGVQRDQRRVLHPVPGDDAGLSNIEFGQPLPHQRGR
ncbi:hypothetical protein [Variovorax ginsengisoli]|uniref:Uncharacterized protein n=1 Tax=Variovorax ginsengisoli TaxID=363844 RepID=A0ABT8SFC6_9BURK|nr:hypothetical protein [Variovorax ginsengisoli]MDN8617011.1 hypothetical protein [Variovorax ginsengisoli]MDO1536181.1 hypothetical protein [Variovorax ginsengisoli]